MIRRQVRDAAACLALHFLQIPNCHFLMTLAKWFTAGCQYKITLNLNNEILYKYSLCRAPDKHFYFNFNQPYLIYFSTDFNVWPLIRIVRLDYSNQWSKTWNPLRNNINNLDIKAYFTHLIYEALLLTCLNPYNRALHYQVNFLTARYI